MPPPVPRAVIFDWDSTLVDNWSGVTLAMNAALDAFNLPRWSEQEMRLRAKRSMRESFPDLFGARWEQARDIFQAAFAEHHLDALAPLPGAEELLSALRERCVLMAVVSNKNGRFLRAEAEKLGWSRYFHHIVGAGDAVRDKPSVEPVDLALRDSGLTPGPDIWFVGDSLVDLQCGIASGCIPVLIGNGAIDPEGLVRWPPVHHFADCPAMCRVLTD